MQQLNEKDTRPPLQVWIEAVRYRKEFNLPNSVAQVKTTLPELCEQAKIELRAEAPLRQIIIYHGSQQFKTKLADIVGVPTKDLESPLAALRALEALAHSFHDHSARACVCKRKLFRSPSKDEKAPYDE